MLTNIPTSGFLRLPQVLAIVPVSKSTWWEGCKSGRFPKAAHISCMTGRITRAMWCMLENAASGRGTPPPNGGKTAVPLPCRKRPPRNPAMEHSGKAAMLPVCPKHTRSIAPGMLLLLLLFLLPILILFLNLLLFLLPRRTLPGNAKSKNHRVFGEDSEAYKLAVLMRDTLRANLPTLKEPDIQAWARDFDLALRNDPRMTEPQFVAQVIRWSCSDAFWRGIIHSPAKLREKMVPQGVRKNMGSIRPPGHKADRTPSRHHRNHQSGKWLF